jgi:hypothetical protein
MSNTCYLWTWRRLRHLPPPPSLCGLYFLCWASLWPMLRTFTCSWLCMTSVCCLHSVVTKLYMYGILNATCKWVGVRVNNILAMVRRTLICRRCNFKTWLSSENSRRGADVSRYGLHALWRVNFVLMPKCSSFKRAQIVINVGKALAAIVSICILHLIFQLKITPGCSHCLQRERYVLSV